MAEASAVFTGKVIKLTKIGVSEAHPDLFMRYDVTFQVAAVIKGEALNLQAGNNRTIRTGAGNGDCGFPFEDGERYLVYTYGGASDLETGICNRTQPLKGAENEILELEGKLPKIRVPARPPELLLKGVIDDAGYHGYVFELRNYLHERIFYGQFLAQVLRDGKWEDYPANLGVEPRKDPQPEEVGRLLNTERREAEISEAQPYGLRGFSYLDRRSTTAFFSARQAQSRPWRVGFRYETEERIDAGRKISKSQRLVWGPKMEASTEARKLTFKESFEGTSMIPYPLGTDSVDISTEVSR